MCLVVTNCTINTSEANSCVVPVPAHNHQHLQQPQQFGYFSASNSNGNQNNSNFSYSLTYALLTQGSANLRSYSSNSCK